LYARVSVDTCREKKVRRMSAILGEKLESLHTVLKQMAWETWPEELDTPSFKVP
jgi:hypothetical protein